VQNISSLGPFEEINCCEYYGVNTACNYAPFYINISFLKKNLAGLVLVLFPFFKDTFAQEMGLKHE
jgi:hypothetical protein